MSRWGGCRNRCLEHAVVVDDAQTPKAHVGRVVIVPEGEGMPAIEPSVLGPAAIFGFPNR